MTVADLIERLAKLPQGAPVVTYRDDGHLTTLMDAPRLSMCFRYDDPAIVFLGSPDEDEIGGGASAEFPCVVLGVLEDE